MDRGVQHRRPNPARERAGTGGGYGLRYGAAVLAACGASVVTVERHPELAGRARCALADTGYGEVRVRTGNGMTGAPDEAPFDAIVVTAMAQHGVPPALLEQLAPDGILVCPIGDRGAGVLVRHQYGATEKLVEVRFVPLVPGTPKGLQLAYIPTVDPSAPDPPSLALRRTLSLDLTRATVSAADGCTGQQKPAC